MNINISGEVVRTSQLPKRIIGLGDYLVALNSSPLETSTVLVSDFVSFLNTQFATSLASLTDVSINTPLIGQALVFNGSQWVNQGIGELDTLDSVTTRGNTTTNSITVGGLYSPYLRLDTVATPTLQPGMFAWNDVDGTANLRLKGNNVTLQIGQETVARVVNKTGADLLESEYKVVRVRVASEGGAQGQRLAVVLAQGDNDPDSATTLGVVTENIGNNQEGFITIFGNVNGINTTGSLQGETWVDGDVLYLSPTTPGGLTKVKPQAPQHTLIVGYVVYAHQNNGKIFVKVDNGYELDELHNVLISSPANNDLLQYNSTQQVWKNIPVGTAVPTPTLAQVTTAGNTTTNAITVGTLYFGNGNHYLVTDNGSYAMLSSNRTLQLATSGNPVLSVFTSQNVAIGTTTDSGYKLDVNGTGRFQGNLEVNAGANGQIFINNLYPRLLFGKTGTPNWSMFADTENSGQFEIGTGAGFPYNTFTSRIHISSAGNVGIGITPIYKLDVNGLVRFQSTGTTSVTHSFLFRNDNSAYGGFTIGSSGQSLSIQQNSGYGYLSAAGFNFGSTNSNIWTNNGSVLDIQNAAGSTTYLRIANTTGNVLIGTTTDAGYKLDVAGTGRFTNGLTVDYFGVNIGGVSLALSAQGTGTISSANSVGGATTYITMRGPVYYNPTSGIAGTFAVTGQSYMNSGTAQFNTLTVGPTINNTGTYSGIFRGFYYNPTLTSLTGTTHRAIETTSGNVIFNGGNVGIGTTGLVPGYLLTINGGVSIAAGQSLSLDPSFGIYMVASSSQFRLYNNSIAALSVASTGNVLINTVTDAGYKLDVSGTFRTLVGTETNPFRLEHTNGNYMTMVVGAGSALAAGQFGMYFNGSPMWSWNGAVFRLHGNTISTASNPSTLILQGGYGGSTVGTSIRLSSNTPNQGQWTATTGAQVTVEVGNHSNETWSPSSGNASYTLLSIAPRINTTGTYAGIVTGFAYNPTLTSVTGVTHRAIHTVTGDVLLGTTSGNVGVGTTSPFGKLDVKDGEIYVTTSTNANLRSRLTYQGLSVSRASDGGYPEQIISTDSAWQYHSRNRHTLYIDTIPHLQIGNVGISGLNIPQSNNIIIGNSADNGYKLQVKGNAYLAGSAGTTTLNVDFGNVNSNVKILSHGSSDFTQIQIGTNFSLSRNGGGDPSIGTTFGLGIISSSLSLQTSTASPGKLWLKGNYGLGSAYFGANNSNGVTASTLYFQNSETPTAAQNVLATFNLWGISDNATAPTIPASSMFSLHSTTRGFLPPRLTTAEILAISSPSEGLQVYNTDLKTICFYNGTAWQRVTSTAM